nr:MAG TPA: hypothetical protein [Caudoviricetes sp.]
MNGLLVLALGLVIMVAVLAVYRLVNDMDDIRKGRRW